MATMMKTPGVYIQEQSAFPNSVVEVATAVPAFIGYTQKADNKGKSLKNVPMRISSLAEFVTYFGGLQAVTFHVATIDLKANAAPARAFTLGADEYAVTPAVSRENLFLLYPSMRLFFDNGGGPCYIVSVGSYSDGPISPDALNAGIDLLEKEQEPTMVVIPDAVHLPRMEDCTISVQQHALLHCGLTMKSRFAILDVYNGYLNQNDPSGDPVKSFRDNLGTNYLDFAAAYYPWLNTTIVSNSDVDYTYVDADDLTALLTAEAALPAPAPHVAADVVAEVKQLSKYDKTLLNKTLTSSSAVFPLVIAEIERQLNLLPPSGAIAGVYSQVDSSRGVWKAPAMSA